MMRSLLLVSVLGGCAFAPPYNVMADYELARIKVATEYMVARCPGLKPLEVRMNLVLPAARASAMGRGADSDAADKLESMALEFESQLTLGEVSKAYCVQMLAGIHGGVVKIRGAYREK